MKPQSFRLTPQAKENLTKIAADYKITESKVINLLLTFPGDGTMENNLAAADIIEDYFTDLLAKRYSE